MTGHQRAKPAFETSGAHGGAFGGFVGDCIKANLEHWLLIAPDSNPAMLEMFFDRDRQPRRALVPWAGEFAGKYLISAVLGYRLTPDARLRVLLDDLVATLEAAQDADGYLGPHPRSERLTGKTHDSHPLWDLWGHYHLILGLLLWHQDSGGQRPLRVATRAADLLCDTFLDSSTRVADAGAEEMNMAVIHGLCLLYQQTENERHLRLARAIEGEWENAPAGDYVRQALAGKEFHEMPKPRWESLHDLQAISELHYLTRDARYRQAFEHLWWSILKGDRHSTGGFSSGEQACGNPYDQRPIETCCTVAWIALSVDMLRLTGCSLVADELELTTFNALVGAQSPSGRWWTYNTPMDGFRRASAHDIVFQVGPGSPELNCCSVNGPRGLGMLSEWAIMTSPDGVVLNYYGPATLRAATPEGRILTLTETTDYPVEPAVRLTLGLAQPERFTLRLRIPAWSLRTTVRVNGETLPDVRPGTYLRLERTWQDGEVVELAFDFSLHFWAGEREAEGHGAIYRGPILLAYDRRYNAVDPHELPILDVSTLRVGAAAWERRPTPWLLLRAQDARDHRLILCDFASAGITGSPYRSWLPITGLSPRPFSRQDPIWNLRP